MQITKTERFDLAYRFITETNATIFLTGKAGTGKTTFLKYLRLNSLKKMVVAAPTGVAAINAGGVTLHSLFQLPFGPILPVAQSTSSRFTVPPQLAKIFYSKQKLNLLRTMELLIIDECSMMASYHVDAIDAILRKVRYNYQSPFGGVQVLFIGDLHQLLPVTRSEEWDLLKAHYSSAFFFDSVVLRENLPMMVELTEVFRQRDAHFVQLLNEIRHNQLSLASVEILNTRIQPDFVPDSDAGFVTLTSHNSQADSVNQSKLQALPGKSFSYKAEVMDQFTQSAFPAEEVLQLKVGAQVMFLRNDSEGKKYFNGKIGTVLELSSTSIRVKCKGEEQTIEVKRFEWINSSYELHPETKEIEEKELGRFVQYPLRLAWAVTIHKSQGLTFDKLVIDSERAFATGQVYVALSRATSLEGLILTSPINTRFLGADHNLKKWNENFLNVDLAERFKSSRQSFLSHVLQQIFSWPDWNFALLNFDEFLRGNATTVPGSVTDWLSELKKDLFEITGVSAKFTGHVVSWKNSGADVEGEQWIQEKIIRASAWFAQKIKSWCDKFSSHPLQVISKPASRKVDETLADLNDLTHQLLHKVLCCKNGFELTKYLRDVRTTFVPAKKMSSSFSGTKNLKSGKVTGNKDLYEQLEILRYGIKAKSGLSASKIFTDGTIDSIAEILPGNFAALKSAKGMSTAKVTQYGSAILSIVKSYCAQNQLEATMVYDAALRSAKRNKPGISSTIENSVSLLKSGKTVNEVALERKLALTTIEGHLAKAIESGATDIYELMTEDEVDYVAGQIPANVSGMSVTQIKSSLPEDIGWGKLRWVLAWKSKGEDVSKSGK